MDNKIDSKKIDKKYVSEIDKFLMNFDKSHDDSGSQQREIDKHQRIFELRDNPEAVDKKSKIWEQF